ncbi:MAG: glycosyltransferase family 4 protein [Gemmatimonadota bacterium]|nr:glycosyltransferase family 4 protein [Gemmatimonadota bacterium]
MLTVALDAEHTRQSAAGIARYTRSLARELTALGEVRVIELGAGEVVQRGSLAKKLLTARQDFAWYPWLARRAAHARGVDVYHSPLPRGPVTRGSPPFVTTVHDLVPLRFPETMTRWSRLYSSLTLRKVLDAADRIIAVSQDTADDLTALAGVSPDKIRVIPNGVDSIFFDRPSTKRPVANPYVLFVGTPEPRKNLARLISAMELLRARGMRERLVIVGAGGWGSAMPQSDIIERVGRASDDELHALYAHASCLALPSLHEGFGLPALEAMAAGTPVVAANTGALPEVTGGAAVLADPLDTDSIAHGITEALANRNSLIARGRARAGEFSWRRTAALTLEVYRELV